MQRYKIIFLLLVSTMLLATRAGATERGKPIKVGALTDSWGPTPGIVGLCDGLEKLGYRENKDFVIGVRFTQGDAAALPAEIGRASCRERV